MRRIVRLLLVALLFVCLPAQAAAIATMPFCGGHAAPAVSAMESPGAGVAHEVTTPAAQDHCAQAHEAVGAAGTDCDRCVLCHLAGVSALPVVLATPDDTLTAVLRAAPPVSPTPFRPDLPDRPPAAFPR